MRPRLLALTLFLAGGSLAWWYINTEGVRIVENEPDARLIQSDLYKDIVHELLDQSEFFGLKITYECEYTHPPKIWFHEAHGSSLLRGIRTLEIGYPGDSPKGIPFRFSHAVQNLGEPLVKTDHVVCYWEAFDGSETRSFNRKLFLRNGNFDLHHSGRIQSGMASYVKNFDPIWQAIFSGSLTQYQIYGGRTASEIEGRKMEWAAPEEFDIAFVEDSAIAPLLRIRNVMGVSLITPPPSCFVVSSPPEDSQRMAIDGLGSFGELRLPIAGTLATDEFQCRYRVLSATIRSKEEMPTTWFPGWETGTTVNDQIQKKSVMYPYTAEELALIHQATGVASATFSPPWEL